MIFLPFYVKYQAFFTLWPEGILSLPVAVCQPVCPSVNFTLIVRAITRHRFELESQNLHQTCMGNCLKMGGASRSFWPFWLRIQGNSACLCNYSSQIWTGTTKFAPNMHHGILGWCWKWGSLTLTFRVILAILIKNSMKFGLFANNNLKWIWVRTAKFAPNVHLWFSRLVLKMGAIDLDLQVHLDLSTDSEFQETAFKRSSCLLI